MGLGGIARLDSCLEGQSSVPQPAVLAQLSRLQQSSWHGWGLLGQCAGGLGGLSQPAQRFQANPTQDETKLNKKPTQCPKHV